MRSRLPIVEKLKHARVRCRRVRHTCTICSFPVPRVKNETEGVFSGQVETEETEKLKLGSGRQHSLL